MGKILSVVSNPFRNFNLESRAHKVISKAKPIPAPLYQKDQNDLERLMHDYPEVYKESLKKNDKLDKYLKNIYVTSTDDNIEISKQNPEKPLPLDRKAVEDFLYGIKEPVKVTMGKTTLRNALEFISKHQNDPQQFTAKYIAKKYMLPEKAVNTLKYFRVFEIYIPQERQVKATFAGPSEPNIKIVKELRKQLPAGPKSDTKEKT